MISNVPFLFRVLAGALGGAAVVGLIYLLAWILSKRCAICGKYATRKTMKTEVVFYKKRALLVNVPVYSCSKCYESYTTCTAERIRDQAVQRAQQEEAKLERN